MYNYKARVRQSLPTLWAERGKSEHIQSRDWSMVAGNARLE